MTMFLKKGFSAGDKVWYMGRGERKVCEVEIVDVWRGRYSEMYIVTENRGEPFKAEPDELAYTLEEHLLAIQNNVFFGQ